VTDPQGAAVSGAKVTLGNTDTNVTLVSISDANVLYQFNALPPAPYRLTIEAQGFAQKAFEQVQIIPDQPNGRTTTSSTSSEAASALFCGNLCSGRPHLTLPF
jgi:hypothetical protein